jgi:hypothetical protein
MESENVESEHIINRARYRCYQSRSRYWGEMVDTGQCSRDTHVTLSHAVLAYYDALMEFEADVDGLPDIEPLRSRVEETTEIRVQSSRRGGGMTTDEVPAVVDVPAEQLIQMSKQLDDVAQQLDFTDSVPR